MSEGAFGHAIDAVMLAAEAEEHLLMAHHQLKLAAGTASSSGLLHGAGYALDAVDAAVTGVGGVPEFGRTAAGLHASAQADAQLAAEHAAAAGQHAQAAYDALAGTSGSTPPP